MRMFVISLMSASLFCNAYGDSSADSQTFTDSSGYKCVKQRDTGLKYICLNYSKIKKTGSGMRMAWTKFIYDTPQVTPNNITFYNYVTLAIYNCKNNSEGIYQQDFYDLDFNVVDSWQVPSADAVQFFYNPPGTIGDNIQEVVCAKK